VNQLADPGRREQLITALQALEKVLRATTGTGASAADAISSSSAASGAHQTVASTSLLSHPVMMAPRWADSILGQLQSLRRAMSGIPTFGVFSPWLRR
jgi:hypothetical protein